MGNPLFLKRAFTRWLVLACIGKAASTRHYYREQVKALRRLWRGQLQYAPDAITPDDVEAFTLRAGHYSASRWNSFVSILRATVPAARTLRLRPVKLTRPPPPTQAEFARLLAECDHAPRSQVALCVAFLAHTGLRITAARNVRWSDVYPDRIEYVGKGGRRCSVPMIPGLATLLNRLRAVAVPGGYVIPRNNFRRALGQACARAGLRNLSPHDFRHFYATRCIESGVDVPTVARWLGHVDGGALLARRYFHLLGEHSREMAARVSV